MTHYRLKNTFPRSWGGAGSLGKGHRYLWNELGGSLLPEHYPTERRVNKFVWNDKNLSHGGPFLDPKLHIYTDASKESNHVGFAWVACDGDYIIDTDVKFSVGMSVYMAEVMAIKEALSWIKKCEVINREFIIFSDSQSAVCTLNGVTAASDTIFETLCIKRDLQKENKIDIKWVRGHHDNTGNEYADALARQGVIMARDIAFADPFLPIDYREIKTRIKEFSRIRWNRLLNDKRDCRISRLFYPTVGRYNNIHMSVRDLNMLTQIVTGHGIFRRHIGHWTEMEDTLCQLCGEEQEDSWHLWQYCPSLAMERREAFYRLESGAGYEKTLLNFFQCGKIVSLRARNEAELES